MAPVVVDLASPFSVMLSLVVAQSLAVVLLCSLLSGELCSTSTCIMWMQKEVGDGRGRESH